MCLFVCVFMCVHLSGHQVCVTSNPLDAKLRQCRRLIQHPCRGRVSQCFSMRLPDFISSYFISKPKHSLNSMPNHIKPSPSSLLHPALIDPWKLSLYSYNGSWLFLVCKHRRLTGSITTSPPGSALSPFLGANRQAVWRRVVGSPRPLRVKARIQESRIVYIKCWFQGAPRPGLRPATLM